jgi:hypothetical protein
MLDIKNKKMNKKIISGGVTIIVMLLVIVGLLTFLLIGQKGVFEDSQKQIINQKVDSVKKVSIKLSCPDGWTKYRQEAVGVEFCYPENKWGKADVEYMSNITNLQNLKESYKEQNVYYNDYFEIDFVKKGNLSKKGSPTIRFFNEDYQGEHYKNARTHHLGYRDNISSLKQSEDICNYKIEFNKEWAEKGSEKEFYTNCKGGVKTNLVEQVDFYKTNNTGWRYQYCLNLFAYKKLQNRYFNNALIKYNIDNSSQLKNKLKNFEEFFNLDHSYGKEKRVTLTRKEFNQESNDFEKFVKSIKVFEPTKEDLIKYKSESANGSSDVELIEKYYWLLTTGDLDYAYGLRVTGQSLVEFRKQYKNVHYAKPYDIKIGVGGQYDFYVEYQDHNSPVKKYQVNMSVMNGKIKTNFVQMFITERIEYEDMIAYGAIRGDESYVILEKNGKEVVVDKGEAKYDKKYTNLNNVKILKNIEFSASGNYLKYSMLGYEWGSGYIYDINKNKNVIESALTTSIKFTPDEEYIYYCAGAGMSNAREGFVKSVPNFNEEFSVFGKSIDGEKYPKNNEYFGVTCNYDKIDNEVIFKLSDLEGKISEKIIKYKLK